MSAATLQRSVPDRRPPSTPELPGPPTDFLDVYGDELTTINGPEDYAPAAGRTDHSLQAAPSGGPSAGRGFDDELLRRLIAETLAGAPQSPQPASELDAALLGHAGIAGFEDTKFDRPPRASVPPKPKPKLGRQAHRRRAFWAQASAVFAVSATTAVYVLWALIPPV